MNCTYYLLFKSWNGFPKQQRLSNFGIQNCGELLEPILFAGWLACNTSLVSFWLYFRYGELLLRHVIWWSVFSSMFRFFFTQTALAAAIKNWETVTGEVADDAEYIKLYCQMPPINKMDGSLSSLKNCE